METPRAGRYGSIAAIGPAAASSTLRVCKVVPHPSSILGPPLPGRGVAVRKDYIPYEVSWGCKHSASDLCKDCCSFGRKFSVEGHGHLPEGGASRRWVSGGARHTADQLQTNGW